MKRSTPRDATLHILNVKATKSSGISLDKRRIYDEAFKAEVQRLASESHRTQAGLAVEHQFQDALPLAASATRD